MSSGSVHKRLHGAYRHLRIAGDDRLKYRSVLRVHTLILNALVAVFVEPARENAIIGLVIAATSLFGWLLIRCGISEQIAQALLAFSTVDLARLLLINLFLLLGVAK